MREHALFNEKDRTFAFLNKAFAPLCTIVGPCETYLKTLECPFIHLISSPSAYALKESFFQSHFQTRINNPFLVTEEPSQEDVERCVAELSGKNRETVLIALGGGSVLDLAKAVKHKTGHLLIAIPTTPGSGAETTPFSILLDAERGTKTYLVHHTLMPNVALLDATLLTSIPRHALGAMLFDVVAHAVESSYSKLSTPLARAWAREALCILETLPDALEKKDWAEMQVAGFLAGCAQGMAATGLCHALAHFVGPRAKIAHSVAVSLFLEETVLLTAQNELGKQALERLDFSPERIRSLLSRIRNNFAMREQAPAPLDMEHAFERIRNDVCYLTHPFRATEEEVTRLLYALPFTG